MGNKVQKANSGIEENTFNCKMNITKPNKILMQRGKERSTNKEDIKFQIDLASKNSKSKQYLEKKSVSPVKKMKKSQMQMQQLQQQMFEDTHQFNQSLDSVKGIRQQHQHLQNNTQISQIPADPMSAYFQDDPQILVVNQSQQHSQLNQTAVSSQKIQSKKLQQQWQQTTEKSASQQLHYNSPTSKDVRGKSTFSKAFKITDAVQKDFTSIQEQKTEEQEKDKLKQLQQLNEEEMNKDNNPAENKKAIENNSGNNLENGGEERLFKQREFENAPLRKKNYFVSDNKEIIVNQNSKEKEAYISESECLVKLIEHGNSVTEYILGNQTNIMNTIQIVDQDDMKDQIEKEKRDLLKRQKMKINAYPGYEKVFQYPQVQIRMNKGTYYQHLEEKQQLLVQQQLQQQYYLYQQQQQQLEQQQLQQQQQQLYGGSTVFQQ